jgi:hypothetical protein
MKWTPDLTNAMHKCAIRKPGEYVTLTDGEVREILSHYKDLAFTELRNERDAARDALRSLIDAHWVRDAATSRNGDWACVECRPHSDVIKRGFRCSYHAALALLGMTETTTSLSESSGRDVECTKDKP